MRARIGRIIPPLRTGNEALAADGGKFMLVPADHPEQIAGLLQRRPEPGTAFERCFDFRGGFPDPLGSSRRAAKARAVQALRDPRRPGP
jgi:hypothetical protein